MEAFSIIISAGISSLFFFFLDFFGDKKSVANWFDGSASCARCQLSVNVFFDLPNCSCNTGSIARIGVRAPWGIQNNQKFTIQRIELYNGIATSIAESEISSYQVQLYPNPTTNSITLNLDGVSDVNIEFIDVQGKLIFSKNQVQSQEQINLSGISQGIYFVRILSDLGNQQIKVRVK